MSRISHGEISLRHFPDASFDISSCQDEVDVLTEHQPRELGLEFDPFDDGELGGLDDDPFTTPLPKAKKHPPLTLSEITPRHEMKHHEIATNMPKTEQQEMVAGPSKEGTKSTERPREKQKQSFVRPVLPKKVSVDDMYERRKRDNYQQMGIDLTSKSTARLRHLKDQVSGVNMVTRPRTDGPSRAQLVGKQRGPASGSQAAEIRTAKTKRPVLSKDAGITKHKPRAPSSAPVQPKSILEVSKPTSVLPSSTLSRTITVASQTPQAERPRWNDVVAEVQQTSHRRESGGSGFGAVGGGLIDVLVMYGEKLKNSLGFSSSAGKDPTSHGLGFKNDIRGQLSDSPTQRTHSLTENPGHASRNTAGPSSKPLTLSDLSPSRPDRRQQASLTLSDLSPSKRSCHMDDGPDTDEQSQPKPSPTRPSRKRPTNGSPSQERKKGRIDPNPDVQHPISSPSSQTIPECGIRTQKGATAKSASKQRPLGTSNIANKTQRTTMNPRLNNQPVSSADNPALRKHRLRAAPSMQYVKGKSDTRSTTATHKGRGADKEQHPPASLTVLSGPAFASDVYRHRALEKTQRERERIEERDKEKKIFKAAPMPYFSKPAPPARPAIRPTIPAAFNFQSDARAALRHAEFEEKRKAWESRATHQALPMPNFAAMHAAQAGAARSRRVIPVLPTDAPTLTTMVRAKERERFEAEKRERERAIDVQREMREKERAHEEERAYKEARKRTVPKAHEVPEWYKDVPRRKEVD